jgi:hypothetical protein
MEVTSSHPVLRIEPPQGLLGIFPVTILELQRVPAPGGLLS